MKQKLLYGIWGFMWLMCALLGHITGAEGAQAGALTVLGLCAFVPGGVLLADGIRNARRKTVLAVRWISGASLLLTAVFFIANIASVTASETTGDVLYEILIFVSSPMMCMQFYPLSLFLWACLLVSSFAFKLRGIEPG